LAKHYALNTKKQPHPKTYFCSECKQTITYGEFIFSLKNFDKPLCRACQPEIEEKISAPPQNFNLNKTSKIEFGEKFSQVKPCCL
jgi:NAD-dependent SIR2 family protein deacetylase